jgi:hypothetical protein
MLKTETTAKLRRAGLEFLTIVTGVLTALALDGWNSSRQDREREQQYLRSLSSDLQTQVERFDSWLTDYDNRAKVAEALWQVVTGSAPTGLSRQDLHGAFVSGGTYRPPRLFSDATYQDLISTGNLRLIRDQRVKSAILNYHALRDQYLEWVDEVARESSDRWRRVSDGLVPASLTRARDTGQGFSDYDFAPVVAAFRNRQDVQSSIANTLSNFEDLRYFTKTARDSAQSLVRQIEAANGGSGRK